MRELDDLARRTIGEVEMLDGPVTLAEYDPFWPERYERLTRDIVAALGERAIRLEHVGSTSVPGLAAKPIVDIVLEVPDSADEGAYVPALEALGYELRIREPEWHEHRMLRAAARDVHVHVFRAGCPETDRMTRFRDRLRSDPAARELYERTKRDLAGRRWRHLQDYADAKTGVVDQILGAPRPASTGCTLSPAGRDSPVDSIRRIYVFPG